MKTILVPVDFSFRSENAARFALKFAQAVKADILLFNAVEIPEQNPMASQTPWPVEDCQTLLEDSLTALKALAVRLKKELDDTSDPLQFKPSVHYFNDLGSFAALAAAVVAGNSISLIIMGANHSNGFSRFLLGSDTHALLDHVSCPVMLISGDAQFKPVHQITYATDHISSDTKVITSLAALAKPFYADIIVTHVSPGNNRNNERETEPELNHISSELIYPKIFYRSIKGENVIRSLNDLGVRDETDILALVHRKYDFPGNLLHSSVSKKMAGSFNLPLIIYPYTFGETVQETENQHEVYQ